LSAFFLLFWFNFEAGLFSFFFVLLCFVFLWLFFVCSNGGVAVVAGEHELSDRCIVHRHARSARGPRVAPIAGKAGSARTDPRRLVAHPAIQAPAAGVLALVDLVAFVVQEEDAENIRTNKNQGVSEMISHHRAMLWFK
jgi:hypothetical protein